MDEVCRLCGEIRKVEELRMSISDPYGPILFKHFIEYYCRYEIIDNINLPQRVCTTCIESIEKFINFCHLVEVVQNKMNSKLNFDNSESPKNFADKDNVYNAAVEAGNEVILVEDNSDGEKDGMREGSIKSTSQNEDKVQKHNNENKVDEENANCCEKLHNQDNEIIETESSLNQSADSLLVPIETPERFKQAQPKKNERMPIHRFMNLFKKELSNPLKSFVKLDIPQSQCGEDGEVVMNDVKCWKDFNYCCTHCKIKYESFDNLLKHFRADIPNSRGGKKWQVKCPDCWGVFSRVKYLNHAQRHYGHLMFCCVHCSKLYKDMSTLLKHYVDHHPESNSVFFCVHCGVYFTDIVALRFHKQKVHGSDYKSVVTTRVNEPAKKRKTPKKIAVKRVVAREDSTEAKDTSVEKPSPKKRGRKRKINENDESEKTTEELKNTQDKPENLEDKLPEQIDKSDEKIHQNPSQISPKSDKIIKQKPCPLSKKPKTSIGSDNEPVNLTNLKSSPTSTNFFTIKSPKPCPLSKKGVLMEKVFITEDPLVIYQSYKQEVKKILPDYVKPQLEELKEAEFISDYKILDDSVLIQQSCKGAWQLYTAENFVASFPKQKRTISKALLGRIAKRRMTCD